MPEILADADAQTYPEARVDRTQPVTGAEETLLVEQPVVGQIGLAVHVPDRPVLEQRRGDEQLLVGRALDEADHHAHAAHLLGELAQARAVGAQGDLGVEVTEQVTGQAELREDEQLDTRRPGLADHRAMVGQVVVHAAERRCELAEADAQAGHVKGW